MRVCRYIYIYTEYEGGRTQHAARAGGRASESMCKKRASKAGGRKEEGGSRKKVRVCVHIYIPEYTCSLQQQ